MQSNIFVKVAPLLKEQKLNIDVDTFIDFLAHYSSKDWIYPTAIHRKDEPVNGLRMVVAVGVSIMVATV